MNIKIYIDTNVYINSILNRDDGLSQDVLIFLKNSGVDLFINDISIINIHYIIRKYIQKDLLKQELKTINNEHILVSVDSKIIDNALDSNFKDFEDAVQYFCAKKIDADVILTDNIKDFKNSGIKVMSVQEFFNKFISI